MWLCLQLLHGVSAKVCKSKQTGVSAKTLHKSQGETTRGGACSESDVL